MAKRISRLSLGGMAVASIEQWKYPSRQSPTALSLHLADTLTIEATSVN